MNTPIVGALFEEHDTMHQSIIDLFTNIVANLLYNICRLGFWQIVNLHYDDDEDDVHLHQAPIASPQAQGDTTTTTSP